MFALLSPRLWVALALAAVLAFTHGMAYRSGRGAIQAKWDKEHAEITAAALTASETARLREHALQKANEGIDRDYQTQKTKLAADKRVTDDSLRVLQAAIGQPGSVAGATSSPDDPRDTIINQCASALNSLDGYAKSVALTAIGLQGYAREVCITN